MTHARPTCAAATTSPSIGGGPAGLAAAALAARGRPRHRAARREPGGPAARSIAAITVDAGDATRESLGRRLLGGRGAGGAMPRRAARRSCSGATVWSLDPQLEIGVSIAGSAPHVEARRVILATGALERPFPIPGWTLPGVMTAGAAQTVLKASGPRARRPHGDRGTGPAALAARGADPARRRQHRGDPRHDAARATGCARCRTCRLSALALLRQGPGAAARGAGARCRSSAASRASRRTARTSSRGRVRARRPASDRMPADLLLLHQGVVPNVNLAMAAGVAHAGTTPALLSARARRGFRDTSVPGIAVAGDGAGIGGAHAAAERGRHRRLRPPCAALQARRVALPEPRPSARRLQREEMGRAFLDTLYRPAPQFRLPGATRSSAAARR